MLAATEMSWSGALKPTSDLRQCAYDILYYTSISHKFMHLRVQGADDSDLLEPCNGLEFSIF